MISTKVTLDFIKKRYKLFQLLNITQMFTTHNCSKFDNMEALCIFLKGFSDVCIFFDLFLCCGRSIPEHSMLSNAI